jgi:HD-GYP domain-containing protein (c-di-GMP phosphodiesterase class II)
VNAQHAQPGSWIHDPDLHGARTGWLCKRVAGLMGLPAEEASAIGAAGQTHDIGKLHVCSSILYKPGPLTPHERRRMERHCLLGAQELMKTPRHAEVPPLMSATVALLHHEWWNGQGYPFGLGGTDIPLAARIVSVADVYDALVSARPYKAAWKKEDARRMLSRQRCEQFDPDCVDAFLEVESMLPCDWIARAEASAPEKQVRPSRSSVPRHATVSTAMDQQAFRDQHTSRATDLVRAGLHR